MKFDLSPVPTNVTIEEATLTVHAFMMEDFNTEGLSATRVTSDWDVETIEMYFPSFETNPFVLTDVDLENGFYEFDVTDMIQGIVQHGEENHGFMLYIPTGVTIDEFDEIYVISCDNYDTWARPKLTITYTTQPAPQ